jgi:hypothetical protein
LDSIKNHITILLRHFDDNPGLIFMVLAGIVALIFVVIVFVDMFFRKRKLKSVKEMYNGVRKYPPRKSSPK